MEAGGLDRLVRLPLWVVFGVGTAGTMPSAGLSGAAAGAPVKSLL